MKKKVVALIIAAAILAGLGVVGRLDYESSCIPHEVTAVSDHKIRTEKGNIYNVSFSVETGKEYIVLFENNVKPVRKLKEIK